MTLSAGPAVRRNIVPLLGIAFVVAVLCTGLFYGVFASRFGVASASSLPRGTVVVAAHDLAAGTTMAAQDARTLAVVADTPLNGVIAKPEQVTGRRLLVRAAEGMPILESMLSSGAQTDIPAGMRAMTIRPADSASVLADLQPGSVVDIQAWSDRGGEPRLRTILQNVAVLRVPPSGDAGAGTAGAITVLVPAAQADAVALADSAAHVRIALRNAGDTTPNGSGRTAVAGLFESHESEKKHAREIPGAVAFPELAVSILGVTESGLRKLSAASGQPSEHGLCVRDLDTPRVWEEALKQTLAARDAVEVSSARVGAEYGNTVQFGNHTWRVRVRFKAGQENRVRIEPEVITRDGGVVTVRRTQGNLDAAAHAGAAAIVTGLCGTEHDRRSAAERAHHAGVKVQDLVIVVRSETPALAASLPRKNR